METVSQEFFGRDARMLEIVDTCKKLAISKAAVLLVGDRGVGKKSLAQLIHQESSRKGMSCEIVDCAQDPVSVENRILGYRDSATGKFNKGALELANNGTVVFANIEHLSDEFQKKLYKILNELSDYDINVRIISTTTKNLSKLVGSGRFYRGLYTLVYGQVIYIPSLKDRGDDVKYLTQLIVNNYNKENNTNISIDESIYGKLLNNNWNENLYELIRVVNNSLKGLEGAMFTESNLIVGEKLGDTQTNSESGEGMALMSLKDAEKLLIKKALSHTSENRTQAAKILGVSIRTLRNKINEYRVDGDSYFLNLR